MAVLKCDGAYAGHVCFNAVEHVEHFYERVRMWCEEHTPWSGHYEDHLNNTRCDDLLQKLRNEIK